MNDHDRACRAALASVASFDGNYPASATSATLADPRNSHLLRYVSQDAFTHVFPGRRRDDPERRFFDDLDVELSAAGQFHLWAEIPLCRYRCHFCQFPIQVVSRDRAAAAASARRWVDANIAEARLWLAAVPALARTPVGEFCLFGGTPTALPAHELDRLVGFYRAHFAFTSDTSLRAEGSPDSLTGDMVDALAGMGFTALTYGIQTFDDDLLRVANRRHTGDEAAAAITAARRAGFVRVDGDLVYGLPGQTVAGFGADVRRMVELDFDTVVAIKLHLRSFGSVDTAIGHVQPTPWEDPAVRRRIAERGYRWPSLGEQFQMRDLAVDVLERAGHYEHPTTYFPTRAAGAERWRALNLDQHLQHPQVGIGLGAYTWSARSEAAVTPDPHAYFARLASGVIPLTDVTGIEGQQQIARSVRMALSTCQPLSERTHRGRFRGSSLFDGSWSRVFTSLERRGLAVVDRPAGLVTLTPTGATLVEAIINTEIHDR